LDLIQAPRSYVKDGSTGGETALALRSLFGLKCLKSFSGGLFFLFQPDLKMSGIAGICLLWVATMNDDGENDLENGPEEHEVAPSESKFITDFNKRWPVVLAVLIIIIVMSFIIFLCMAFGPMGNFRS
jgi:hypothetical protein